MPEVTRHTLAVTLNLADSETLSPAHVTVQG